MANHPSDPQSPRSEATLRRSLRESMNMANGPGPRDPVDDDADRAPSEPSAEESASGRRFEEDAPQEDAEEITKLEAENEQLRGIVDELRQQLEQSVGDNQSGWGEREREYEAMLEQKTETIRELHSRLEELSKGPKPAAPLPNVNQEELSALSDEIERERCRLEQERRQIEEDRKQIREDEESMMRQMREMELQMAKERAELARQRNELQRLHSEIRHELELAQRDAAVNERLRLLQRRSSQLEAPAAGKGSSAETKATSKKRTTLSTPAAKSDKDDKDKAKKKSSGTSFFGRFFGKDK
jgi:chromosome segregation ATPase